MPSHQIRVQQNNCEHEVSIGLIYWNGQQFIADCIKCDKNIPQGSKMIKASNVS